MRRHTSRVLTTQTFFSENTREQRDPQMMHPPVTSARGLMNAAYWRPRVFATANIVGVLFSFNAGPWAAATMRYELLRPRLPLLSFRVHPAIEIRRARKEADGYGRHNTTKSVLLPPRTAFRRPLKYSRGEPILQGRGRSGLHDLRVPLS